MGEGGHDQVFAVSGNENIFGFKFELGVCTLEIILTMLIPHKVELIFESFFSQIFQLRSNLIVSQNQISYFKFIYLIIIILIYL